MELIVPMLDEEPSVVAYSWFSYGEGRSVFFGDDANLFRYSDGSPNELGSSYFRTCAPTTTTDPPQVTATTSQTPEPTTTDPAQVAPTTPESTPEFTTTDQIAPTTSEIAEPSTTGPTQVAPTTSETIPEPTTTDPLQESTTIAETTSLNPGKSTSTCTLKMRSRYSFDFSQGSVSYVYDVHSLQSCADMCLSRGGEVCDYVNFDALALSCTMAPATAFTGEHLDLNMKSARCTHREGGGGSSSTTTAPDEHPPTSCVVYDNARFDAEVPEATTWAYRVADAGACRSLCVSSASCNYFNFHPRSGACGQMGALRSPAGPGEAGTFADTEGKVAGDCSQGATTLTSTGASTAAPIVSTTPAPTDAPATTVPSSRPQVCMLYEGARFDAQSITWAYHIADSASCSDLCIGSSSCNFFNFHSTTGACGQITSLGSSGPGEGGTFVDSADHSAADCSGVTDITAPSDLTPALASISEHHISAASASMRPATRGVRGHHGFLAAGLSMLQADHEVLSASEVGDEQRSIISREDL